MNPLILVVSGLFLFYLGYRFYARYLAKNFGEDDSRPTPSHSRKDDVDFAPTKTLVLFGHHFASIAGGGPIIGPTLALVYGYAPVWFWIVLGTLFLGAVHDYGALFTSMREKGSSIAEVAQSVMGRWAFFAFVGFTIIMLLMVTSVFLKLTAASLTSLVPTSQIPESQHCMVKRVVMDGVEMFKIGGIASTSVIIITLFAPLLGFSIYKRKVNPYFAALFAVAVCIVSIFIGIRYPVSLSANTWMIIISIYTIFAAGIPVWLVLQPRDFTNVFLLYGGILLLLIGTIISGLTGIKPSAPAFNVAFGSQKSGPIVPILFITVACGAISGFHSLVSGGTSSKQINKESDARLIGYGAMLLEGALALSVLIAIAYGIDFNHYLDIVYPQKTAPNPILGFSLAMGGLLNKTIGINFVYATVFGILMVEGFVVTTLDTAVRLNRYLLEELWQIALGKRTPKFMQTYIFNSLLAVLLMYLLAHTQTIAQLWKIFGSANQLLAAFALTAVSAWLFVRGKKLFFVALPAIFMFLITISSLIWLLFVKYLPEKNYALITADAVLLILSAIVVVLALALFLKGRKSQKVILNSA